MKSKFYTLLKAAVNRKLLTVSLILAGASLSVVLLSYKDGPASHGEHVTGAPFDSSQFCTKCHGGGNFGASFTARLYRADKTIVNAYVPGTTYYFVIITKNTTGIPLHGFQTTSATTTTAVNINGWKNLPAGTASRLVLGHNYVEHTAPFSLDTTILPWRAPAAGTGSVTFYTACNFVNGNNKPTGDQPIKNTFTVAEGVATFADQYTGPDYFASKIQTDKKRDLIVYKHAGMLYMRYNNTGENQTALIQLNNIQGNLIYRGKVSLNQGNNIFPIQATDSKGFVIATITTADGIKTTKKIILE